ncbi:MAG TPA: L,D-transpeptidase family protein [Acidimicrobiales bacterium]|nr:L,D-transpeptidase family protein [Acidimicrobiales bacterium]
MTIKRGVAWALVGAVVVLGLAACSTPSGEEHAAALIATPQAVDPTVTSSPTVDTTTPAVREAPAVAPDTTLPPPPPPGLGDGDQGPGVAALEQRLDALRYEVGTVDDVFDGDTEHGVMAFQKANGLERTGRATGDVVTALGTAKSPASLVPDGGAGRVEVDLNRQVLFLYEAGSLYKVLSISSGSGERFCSQGYCRNAVTPQGSFAIYEQRHGWEKSPLGRLYNSQYFEGGYAIHGSTSVPAEPASHGCIRIPMNAAEWFPDHVTVGTPVYVMGDEGTPAPRAPQPPAAPASSTPSPEPTVSAGPASPPPLVWVPPVTAAPAPTTTTTRPLLGLFGSPQR